MRGFASFGTAPGCPLIIRPEVSTKLGAIQGRGVLMARKLSEPINGLSAQVDGGEKLDCFSDVTVL